MIRVLHCVETIGSGGVEQRRLLLAKYLDKDTFSQSMICSNVKAEFDQKLIHEGMPVFRIGSLRHVFHIGYYIRLIRAVRKIKPHIIHGAVFEGVISAVVAGMICRVPIIIIEETSDPTNRSRKAVLLFKFLSFFADFVVGISPSVVTYLTRTANVNQKKIRLINNAVDKPLVPSADQISMIREKYGIQDSDFVVGSVGRMFDGVKRFSDLIKALPDLIPSIPEIKLLLVGGGRDLDSLRDLAKAIGVDGYVIFTDFQSQTSLYYSVMDVFTLVSDNEGFGLVVVEAMFFNLPVVVTSVGGLKDIVVDGYSGFHVNKHSPFEIGMAIRSLYNDKEKRLNMGKFGYERANNEYNASRYVENILRLYEEALVKKKIKH